MDRQPGLERTDRISEQELERFRLAMDHSGDIIVLIDRETMRFVDVNATACRLLGYTREELLAMGPQDVLTVPREVLERSYDELIGCPAVVGRMSSAYLCRDGSRLPFESTRHVLRAGDKWLIAAISRDIRERLAGEQALRGSEERFRALTELSSDLFWEQDADYRFTAVSGSASVALKRRLESQIGRHRWDSPAFNMDAAAWAAHRADLDARRAFRDLELGRFDADGERFWVSISGAPVFDASGAFAGYRGVGKDITARKREERLRVLEHATARVLAEAPSPAHAVRDVMRIVCESENWECGRYFELDEAAGCMRFHDAWSSDESSLREFVEASRGQSCAPGEGLVGKVWEQGEPLWVEDASRDPRVAAQSFARKVGLHAALVLPLSFDGRVIGVLSISSRRVSRPDERLLGALRLVGGQLGQYLMRKKAELALGDSEARLRRTFDLAASGIAHVGLDGRFLKVNRRLCEMLGYPEDELVGRTAEDLTHPEDRGVSAPALARMRAGELATTRFEKRYVRKDGSMVWAHVSVALVRGSNDVPEYEIAVVDDITERKENEARQLRRDQELSRFRTALDASADMVFLIDLRDLSFIDFNETATFMLGYRREELLRRDSRMVLAGVSTEELRASHAPLLARPERSDLVVRTLRRKDGSVFEAEVLRHVVDSPDGPILVLNVRDLTERRRSEERQAAHLRYQETVARFAQSALGCREATELVDEAVRSAREALNAAAVAYYEDADGERVLRGAAGPVPPAGAQHDRTAVRVRSDTGDQGELCAWSAEPNGFGPEEGKFLAAAAAVLSAGLSRIQSEGRLAFLAQFDVLTGLPNRALLSDRFSQLIVQARRHASTLGVLFIDLDDFKLVNDSLGHAGGDELLKETARRLQ